MAFATLNGTAISDGRLTLPRSGLWLLDAVVEAESAPAGRVALAFGSTTLSGAVVRAGLRNGIANVRVVGGAGGLAKLVPPKSYLSVPLRIPATDILAAAGEQLSAASMPALLAATLSRWAYMQMEASAALAHLLEGRGVSWRAADDGSVWLGADGWEEVDVDHELLDGDVMGGRVEIAAEDPTVRPGTTFLGRRVSYVAHQLGDLIRTEVWFE